MATACTLVGLLFRKFHLTFTVYFSEICNVHVSVLICCSLYLWAHQRVWVEFLDHCRHMCAQDRIKVMIDVEADEMVELAIAMEDGWGGEDKKQDNV